MRLPRVRFSLRMLMATVAIVAAILGLLERRARFSRISLAHRMEMDKLRVNDLEMFLLLTASQSPLEATPSEKKAWLEAEEEWNRAALPLTRFMQYHRLMGDKYERASARPWLPIASDLPPPAKPSQEDLKAILAPLRSIR